jgi:endoglucanase
LSFIRVAKEAGIPAHPAVFGIYGSDANAFTRHGVQAGLIVVPTRYTHSPFEMVHLGDVEHTARLLQAFLETPLQSGVQSGVQSVM